MNSQAKAHAHARTTATTSSYWIPWLPRITFTTALRATVLTTVILVLAWAFGNSILRKIASFILATPIVLVLSLLTLAASNVAFSILYTRRQRLAAASASATSQSKSSHNSRTMPGSASCHRFHYLRPAKFTRPVAWSIIEKQRRQEQAAKYRTPIADTMPQFSEAVDTLIELIIRDYVAVWMRAITPEVVLQQRIEELLRMVLIRFKCRVVDLDLTQLLVTRLVPKVTAHVNDFRKAEMALRGNSLERSLTESDELDIMVASKFRNGKLHRALSTSISTQATEEAYLRNVVQTILPTLLPKSEVQSEVLRHLLRELLVGAVLRPVMDLLSDPDYWNQNVDLYIGKAIREQNMVKKLREALKQHTDNMDADPRIIDNQLDPYGTGGDMYRFEDFLKMIKHCDSLLDVKRIRNTIMTEMRKKKAQIVGREKEDVVNGNKVTEIIIYINRLDVAKRRAEKRIEALGGPVYPKRRPREFTLETKNTSSLINLDIILSNPSGLSYFMEFQDRRDNMNELQFWLLIDTLNIRSDSEQKTETDSLGSLSADERALMGTSSTATTPSSTLSRAQAQRTLGVLTPTSAQTTGGFTSSSNLTNSIRSSRKSSISATFDITDTLRDDVRMIYETYFAESAPRPVVVDHSLVDVFRDFALSESVSSKGVPLFDSESKKQEELRAANVRQKLLVAQRQVFEQMLEKDYPEFLKSDLYFKFLTSYQNTETKQEQKGPRGHSKTSSVSRPSSGPGLFSAIGLSAPDKRRDSPENPKRSSTGSFLDIFGLGRDKDKERERDQNSRSPMKRAETAIGHLRTPFLPSGYLRSQSGSPVSTKSMDLGDQQQQHEPKPKQSLEVPSSSKLVAPPLARTRSLSSISNPETPVSASSWAKSASSHRKSIFTADHRRDNSLDLTDTEALVKVGADDGSGLRDSLLLELQENEDEGEEGLMGDNQGGVPIPRMSKDRRDKENVINAVEAALSSIMESPDTQHEDLSVNGSKERDAEASSLDATDPSFSTARDEQPGANALLEWGQSQQKNSRRQFKESSLESGKTVRAKSRDPSEVDRASLDSSLKFKKGREKSGQVPQLVKQSRFAALDTGLNTYGEGHKDEKTGRIKMAGETLSEDSDGELALSKKHSPTSPGVAESISDTVQDNIHLAAPGDLLLSARIKKLEQDIETVRKQEAIVETLIQKAERQGRQNELRILKKSKSALRREILSMEYQKTQYEVQEEENMIMPGRSTINITSSTVGHEGSKEFALYVIEVHQLAQDGSFASGWVIARRYSEFFALHQQLKEKYPSIVRQYELPGKRGFLKLQKSFVEGRRIGLERYLQCLVQHIEICQSQELRAFLSQENVALPQFSSATPALIPYSLFDNDGAKEGAKQSNAAQPGSPFFFEQLFQSATSPLHSPVASRDLSRNSVLSNAGSGTLDAFGGHDVGGEQGVGPNDGFMKHIYQTVSEGLDDMFSGGPPTVLGNITKQLGNQMMQFTMEMDDEEKADSSLIPSGTRRRHGSHDESGSVRLVQSEIIDRTAPASSFDTLAAAQGSEKDGEVHRPPLQRIQSSRSRRLSSPDPHTQHQRMQFQLQQQEQHQSMLRQKQILEQQAQQQQEQQQQQQQQQPQQARQGVVEPEGVTTFTEPLCDLFIELFELKEKNNWLRRQAVVIILQQVLGGTIERKLRDTIKAYIEESMLTFYVLKLRDALWPNNSSSSSPDLTGEYEVVGEDLRLSPTMPRSPADTAAGNPSSGPKKVIRTPEQKALTKDQANRKLSVFLPELLGNMVGHQNARRGARRVFAAFQNRRLNQQLVYTTLDEVIAAMWPELVLPSSSTSSSSTLPNAVSAATTSTSTATALSSMALPPNAGLSMAEVSDSGERSASSSRSRSRSNTRDKF
ncbi:Intermediate filament protein [Gamsiella multidivaricata]|nr:Intermediate filament protein [Gamsiella multidivaricata]